MAAVSTIRHRWIGAVAILLLLGTAAVGAMLIETRKTGSTVMASEQPAYALQKVRRRTLTVASDVTGSLGYGTTHTIPIRAQGTLTWLPDNGAVISRGQPLMRVDDQPIVLMYGRVPAFRTLSDTSATDAAPKTNSPRKNAAKGSSRNSGRRSSPPPEPMTGVDVAELEANLSAMGYTGFTVDDTFTSYTAAAVKRWQSDLGMPATGVVDFGTVVFLPHPIRAVVDRSELGEPVSASAVKQTSSTQRITADAPDDAPSWVHPGMKVTVSLSNQRRVGARVTSVAEPTRDDTVPIDLEPDRRIEDGGDVTVHFIKRQRKHVLSVPVTALVALAEGGYGLQRADGSYVPVTPGMYADGFVQVSGEVTSHTRIRVPR